MSGVITQRAFNRRKRADDLRHWANLLRRKPMTRPLDRKVLAGVLEEMATELEADQAALDRLFNVSE